MMVLWNMITISIKYDSESMALSLHTRWNRIPLAAQLGTLCLSALWEGGREGERDTLS
jgi:hypothetical protein